MPFSLYGDLPQPASEKESGKSNSSPGNNSSFSGLYSSLPAPGSSSNATSATASEERSNITTRAPTVPGSPAPANSTSSPASKPAGWSAYSQFRPVMRKPTIQAKPKLNRVIPAGATVVSTTTVNKDAANKDAVTEPSATATTVPPTSSSTKDKTTLKSLPRQLNNIPYLSTSDDVNGFKASQQNKKKGKNKGKQQQQQQAQPIVFDMTEDYDPHRPNDYEQYKEERRQLREELKRQKRHQRRQQRQRSRSASPYSSEDDYHSRSQSPKGRGCAFAPPANLYESSLSERKRSSSPPSPPRHRQPSPPPTHAYLPKVDLDLNESAEDAYMRRVRMSNQRAAASMQPRVSPTEEDIHDDRPMLGLGAASDKGLGRGEDVKGGRASGGFVGASSISQPFVAATQSGSPVPRIVESPVVLLTNMVGPGEVDDMLQEETADECSKYGQVERCLIFEVPHGQVPDDQAVRIFVKFRSIDAARSALNDLNGRYFGGRIVTAKFYDRARFDKLDLAPSPNEHL